MATRLHLPQTKEGAFVLFVATDKRDQRIVVRQIGQPMTEAIDKAVGPPARCRRRKSKRERNRQVFDG
jgi:hypothetical protein